MALSLFSAGAKLRASVINAVVTAVNGLQTLMDNRETCYQTGSTSASSAIGTSVTSVLSISNVVFKAGRAYSVENVGGAFGSVANEADFSLWKNSTAGTQVGAFYRTRCATLQTNAYGLVYLRNTAGTDVTFTALVLAVAASTGTVTHDAATNRPRQLIVRDVGLASAYANAYVVT